jgi:hypothetical protein
MGVEPPDRQGARRENTHLYLTILRAVESFLFFGGGTGMHGSARFAPYDAGLFEKLPSKKAPTRPAIEFCPRLHRSRRAAVLRCAGQPVHAGSFTEGEQGDRARYNEQHSRAGWIGAQTAQVIFARALSRVEARLE